MNVVGAYKSCQMYHMYHMYNKNTSSDSTNRKGELDLCIQTAMVLTIVVTSNSTNKLGLSRAKLSTAEVEFCKVMLH